VGAWLCCLRAQCKELRPLRTLTLALPLQVKDESAILSGQFVQDDALLVTAHASASIAVWRASTGRQLAFYAADSPIWHVACTPRGALALGTEGGSVHFATLPSDAPPSAAPESSDDGEHARPQHGAWRSYLFGSRYEALAIRSFTLCCL
jgi:hypothetical protein